MKVDPKLTTEALLLAYERAKKTVPVDATAWPHDAEFWEGQMFKHKGVLLYFLAFDVFWIVTPEGLVPACKASA